MLVIDLGRMGHAEALKVQIIRLERVAQGAEPTLYLVEHEPVVTLGKAGRTDSLRVSPEILAARGVALERTGRGGDVTCHFPGQLVADPLFRLDRRPGGVRRFVHDLEEVVIRTVARFDIEAARSQGRPGVWVGERKIASLGIGVRRWVSYHGFALNITADLGLFDCITPCGLAGVEPTSICRELGRDDISMEEVKHDCLAAFAEVFAPARMVAG
jgi:lipoyl(octanoyl) transferase